MFFQDNPIAYFANLSFAISVQSVIALLLMSAAARWAVNVMARFIPERMLYEWRAEIAHEMQQSFTETPPSLWRAAFETSFIPKAAGVLTKTKIDWVQLLGDLACLCVPLTLAIAAKEINVAVIALSLLCWAGATSALIDSRHMLLPDVLTYPMVWLGLLLNTINLFAPLESAVTGAAIIYLLTLFASKAYEWAIDEEGVGLGDVKWVVIPGAWFGAESAIHAITLASIIGVAQAILSRKRQIAFGPALTTSVLLIGLFKTLL